MKIVKENYDEMLNLLADGIVCATYNRECFSKSEVEKETIAWNEMNHVADELVKAGVNFDKFVVPVMDAYGIELNKKRLEEIRKTNTSDTLANDLSIEVECPLLENVEEWAYGGHRLEKYRIKVID